MSIKSSFYTDLRRLLSLSLFVWSYRLICSAGVQKTHFYFIIPVYISK